MRTSWVGLGLVLAATSGCGDEDKVTGQRGMGGSTPINNGGSRRSGGGGGGEEGDPETERPDRPAPVLTRDDFSARTRDPFHNYSAAKNIEAPEPIEVVRAEREVKLSQYTFEELRLIVVVNAGRSVKPTALFLSPDNKSKSIAQGEYFSSAQVLLASVNEDCIEIEMVDPDLSPGWNMERGDQKLICLKKEN